MKVPEQGKPRAKGLWLVLAALLLFGGLTGVNKDHSIAPGWSTAASSSTAQATTSLDWPKMRQTALVLLAYDKACSPLPETWRELATMMVQRMDDNERASATAVVKDAMRSGTGVFCAVAKVEVVERLGANR